MDQPIFKQPLNPAGSPARDADRDSLLLKAVLRFESIKDDNEVRIRNLSAGGLMAEAPLRVARGEKVEINLRNVGWISGTIAWVAEGRLGIAFDHAIDPKIVRKPVGQSNADIPLYLQKINQQHVTNAKNLRRV
jgi:PilZ domain